MPARERGGRRVRGRDAERGTLRKRRRQQRRHAVIERQTQPTEREGGGGRKERDGIRERETK